MSHGHFIADIKREYPNAEILAEAKVVWHEWDLDGWVALVKHGEETSAFTTDHGSLVKMTLAEANMFMRSQISNTQSLVDGMKDFQGAIGAQLKA